MAKPLKTNKKNQEKTLKLSRRQKWRRNPAPWAVLLVAGLAIAGLWVIPNGLTWLDQKDKIEQYQAENAQIEAQIAGLKKTRNQEKEKFNQLAKTTLSNEAQRFPETVDANKIARVMEIYALQLNLSRRTFVDLKTLSFSSSRRADQGDYYETPATLTISVDESSLKRLIEFLQTGKYDQQLTVDTISPENKGETAALEFLDSNLMPLLHISTINLTEDNEAAQEFPRTVYSVQMQLAFFSQFE